MRRQKILLSECLNGTMAMCNDKVEPYQYPDLSKPVENGWTEEFEQLKVEVARMENETAMLRSALEQARYATYDVRNEIIDRALRKEE